MPVNNSTNYLPQTRLSIPPCVPPPLFSHKTPFDYYYSPEVKFKKIIDNNFRELIQQILRYFHQLNIIQIWVVIPAII